MMAVNASTTNPEQTLMFQEAASAHEVVARQLTANADRVAEAVKQIRAFEPAAVVTMARGSSDHAATYAKYLIETRTGTLTSSASPSVSSVYGTAQRLKGVLYIAISQSGKSPDLLAGVEKAKAAGALTLAFVNVEDSPLAALADLVIPLHAGPEKSVAATKSYIATLSAVLHLVTEWSGDELLGAALKQLPASLKQAWQCDWTKAVDALKSANNLFVIGRGLGFGVAQEAALKFKETCGLHAEAFSSAEVKHGPMAIVKSGFPVLMLSQQDETYSGFSDLIKEFQARDARVLVASEKTYGEANLPVVHGAHPAIAPLLAVQSFYKMANALSVARGYNPDEPPHLRKVTETL